MKFVVGILVIFVAVDFAKSNVTELIKDVRKNLTEVSKNLTDVKKEESINLSEGKQETSKNLNEVKKEVSRNVTEVKSNINSIFMKNRRVAKSRSTSSSGEGKKDHNSGADSTSLDESSGTPSKSSGGGGNNKRIPKSTEERHGWRKWHRKCTPCPDDMKKKWRDPSIRWICGAYQRARRTFKSSCMMRYRNCQDGTMFVKIHENRCGNDSERLKLGDKLHGEHFFYSYFVRLTDDDTDYGTGSEGDTMSEED